MNNKFSKTLIAVLVSQTVLFGCFKGSSGEPKPEPKQLPKELKGQVLNYKQAVELDKEIDKELDQITNAIGADAAAANAAAATAAATAATDAATAATAAANTPNDANAAAAAAAAADAAAAAAVLHTFDGTIKGLGLNTKDLGSLDKEVTKERLAEILKFVNNGPVCKYLLEFFPSFEANKIIAGKLPGNASGPFLKKQVITPLQAYVNTLWQPAEASKELDSNDKKRQFLKNRFPGLEGVLDFQDNSHELKEAAASCLRYASLLKFTKGYTNLVAGVQKLNEAIAKVTANINMLSLYNESDLNSPYKQSLAHQREQLNQLIEVQEIVQEIVGDQSQLEEQVKKAKVDADKAKSNTLNVEQIFLLNKACQLAVQAGKKLVGSDVVEKLQEQLEELRNAS